MEYLELDGYCKDFGIGFEYNGLQHYEYIPHFHRNGTGDLDKRKRLLCDTNVITLIIIPSCYSYLEPDILTEFIYSELARIGM